MRKFLLPWCLLALYFPSYSQHIDSSAQTAANRSTQAKEIVPPFIDSKTLSRLQAQYASLDKILQQRTSKVLAAMQAQECSLQRSVAKKDSSKAQQLFGSARQTYLSWQAQLSSPNVPGASPASASPASAINVASASPISQLTGAAAPSRLTNPLKEYIPRVDSLSTALSFLQQPGTHLPTAQLQQVHALSVQFQQLQSRLQQANDVQAFISQREQQLKDHLSGYGGAIGKQLLGMNQQVYYYQEELSGYKATLKDPEKMQSTVMQSVQKLPAFQNFMAKNSYLSSLFPASPNAGTAQALTGLQTMKDIQQQLQDRYGKSALTPPASGGGSPLQQQVQSAQAALSHLKDRVMSAGGNSTDMTQPDFTPNKQKGKTFRKRFEYGFNIQSQPGTSILPVTSDIGLSLGYKLSDKATAGVGASYKVGWGSGLNNVHVTNQGVGLRSYVDVKAKGSIWITGGWEYNYYQLFSKLSDIRNLDIWQKSALIGVTKKYKIGSRNGNMQLLYDLLAGQQTPSVPPIKFRIGYVWR